MKKMKYLRTWLVVALVVTIIGSLTGGTVAWFTDNVESTENLIKSGILDIKLYAADEDTYTTEGFAWADTNEVKDGSPALFTYELWEPGYTEVRYLKIENAGNLALKYQFGINPSSITAGGQSNLAEVIDMYVFDSTDSITRDTIAAATPVGTLEELKGEGEVAFSGYLLPAEGSDDYNTDVTTPRGSVEKVIVLKMQEGAGNEYQNCSLSNVGIKLEAAQYTWENDFFDHMYDDDAEFGTANVPAADVSEMNDEERENIFFVTQNTHELRKLDVGYIFKTTETYEEAQQNPFALWHADFVVSLDKDIPAMSAGLAGSYESYKGGDWIGFDLTQEIIDDVTDTEGGNLPAGTEFRLLEAYDDREVVMNYEELCLLVKEFKCGAYAIDDAAKGATMTVELRIYETKDAADTEGNTVNEETGVYKVVAKYEYTF